MSCGANLNIPGVTEANTVSKQSPGLSMFIDSSFASKDEALESLGITPEQSKKWADKQQGHERSYNTPEMGELAARREAGLVSQEEWVSAVRDNNMPVSFNEVQDVPSYNELVMSLDNPHKGIINTGGGTAQMKKLPTGMKVASRLDIPAYKFRDTWVVTIHVPSKGKAGKVIGYSKSAHLKNVTFQDGARQMKSAMKMAQGANKAPIATFIGDWVNTDTDKVVSLSEEALASDGWVQVGMNPDRGEFFYDKNGFKPVASAKEVLQVGSLLMARGVKYLNKEDDVGNTSKRAEPLVDPQGDDGFTVMPTEIQPNGERKIVGTIAAEPSDVNGATDYTVNVAEMNNDFIGKGKGVELYLTMVEELLKKGVNMGGFGRVPDYLSSGGMTTESAMRVWRSIYKNLDKHLEKFPNLKGAILLMPSNEKGMIFHKGTAKLKDGGREENQYEQDVGQEPAFSIELYPETYKKNVAKKQKHKATLHTVWDDVNDTLTLRDDTPQSPGFFAYEKATPATKHMVDFALRHDTDFRINADGSLSLDNESYKQGVTTYEGRVKVHDMKELRAFLGY